MFSDLLKSADASFNDYMHLNVNKQMEIMIWVTYEQRICLKMEKLN